MGEYEVITQPTIENTIANNLMEICQQNILAIQNPEKDITIIKKNTSKIDDTYGND